MGLDRSMWFALVCLTGLVYGRTIQTDIVRYHGYKVLRVHPTIRADVESLKKLAEHFKLDIWHTPRNLNDTFDAMVGPEIAHVVEKSLTFLKLKFEVIIEDVERLVEHERRDIHQRRKRATTSLSDYTRNFISYTDTEAFLSKIHTSGSHIASTTLINIGQSTEGRQLTIIKITRRSSTSTKPAIFIDAGIHAREWIAPATALNFIYQLVVNPDNDPAVTTLLDHFDWYIMPLVNPDGFQHSRNYERMWRKTRSYNAHSHCRGVDANRNFEYQWNPDVGGSRSPCEDIYAGERSFSIPESTNLGSFMRNHGNSTKAYLTLHSYGQMFMYPYGYSAHSVASDYRDLDHLARTATRVMAAGGYHYTVGVTGRDLYPAAGGSDDYAKGVAGIKYSYTVELPPSDSDYTNGFIISSSQIPSITANTWRGVKAFAAELARMLSFNDTPSNYLSDVMQTTVRNVESHTTQSQFGFRYSYIRDPVLVAYLDSLPVYYRYSVLHWIHQNRRRAN